MTSMEYYGDLVDEVCDMERAENIADMEQIREEFECRIEELRDDFNKYYHEHLAKIRRISQPTTPTTFGNNNLGEK